MSLDLDWTRPESGGHQEPEFTLAGPGRGSPGSVLTLEPVPTRGTSARATAQVFEDPRSIALLERVGWVAPSDATVLVTGETGTGKELIARFVHQSSRRAGGPFVAVNCGALPESLVESELFGYERGAFTGAAATKPGWFEAAHGGTLFLDEVGDLPLAVQVKLLRVLQEREVVRIGARRGVPIDVRVVAATNVRLRDAVSAGRFREDLFYRLNVVELALPPLRERPGDVLPLVRHFVAMHCARLGCDPLPLDPAAERRLIEHPWPGNIRELENAVQHAVLVCRGSAIGAQDLNLAPVTQPCPESGIPALASPEAMLQAALFAAFEQPRDGLFERIEEAVMRCAFEYCERNQVQAARLLGISRNVLRARLIRSGDISARR